MTVLCEDEGVVDIAAWWQIPWWARPIRSRINAQAKSFATQWLEDISTKGIDFIEDSQAFLFVENQSEHSKTVGDDEE